MSGVLQSDSSSPVDGRRSSGRAALCVLRHHHGCMATEEAQRPLGIVGGVIAAPFLAWGLTLVVPYLFAPAFIGILAFAAWPRSTGWRRAAATGLVVGAFITLAYCYF